MTILNLNKPKKTSTVRTFEQINRGVSEKIGQCYVRRHQVVLVLTLP